MFFKVYFELTGLYYSLKVIFVANYVSRMVFEGGILGAWSTKKSGYLNSTTVLFDNVNTLLQIRDIVYLVNLYYPLHIVFFNMKDTEIVSSMLS